LGFGSGPVCFGFLLEIFFFFFVVGEDIYGNAMGHESDRDTLFVGLLIFWALGWTRFQDEFRTIIVFIIIIFFLSSILDHKYMKENIYR